MAVKAIIVDDSISIRDIIRLDLESIGCQVVAEAPSIAPALNLFRTVRPELIALDILLPQVEGLDAIGFMRIVRKEAPRVPILIVGAALPDEVREAFLAEGTLDHIVGPFDHENFRRILTRLREFFPSLKAEKSPRTSAPPGPHPHS
jgi:CheY-like chemotaxis protein